MEFLFGLLFSAILGLAFGSYSTMLTYRLPRKESCFGRYFGPKSRCRNCKATLRTRDLLPIFNWLLTGGKCKFCGFAIKKTYLFTESAVFASFIICFLKYGISDRYILYALLMTMLVIITTTEFESKMISWQMLVGLFSIGLVIRTFEDKTILAIPFLLAIAICGSAIFCRLLKKYSSIPVQMNWILFFISASLWLSGGRLILFTTLAACLLSASHLAKFKVISSGNIITFCAFFILIFA